MTSKFVRYFYPVTFAGWWCMRDWRGQNFVSLTFALIHCHDDSARAILSSIHTPSVLIPEHKVVSEYQSCFGF